MHAVEGITLLMVASDLTCVDSTVPLLKPWARCWMQTAQVLITENRCAREAVGVTSLVQC